MTRTVYVNGRFEPRRDGAVDIEDRGFQFADGVYEVCLAIDGAFWDIEAHLDRLERSLAELRMRMPAARAALPFIMRELLRRNRLRDALLYLQTTRGAAPRGHAFPAADTPPSIVMTARGFDLDANDAIADRGVKVISTPDIRWGRVDIKTVSLLPNALAKQEAAEAGVAEAWLLREGVVTEGSSSNAWIIDEAGALRTHPTGRRILGGVTRMKAMECAREIGVEVIEEAFTLDEAKRAREAFMTSATSLVTGVVSVDGTEIADGRPGAVTGRLREAYKAKARAEAAPPGTGAG